MEFARAHLVLNGNTFWVSLKKRMDSRTEVQSFLVQILLVR